ncbi:MAG: glycosyltransferase family 2 protein [Verrucomicrobiota bacterium]
MDLSVIIVNWNTKDFLHNCLRSIETGSPQGAVETIVVDNRSSDGSAEMVARSFPRATLINSGGNLGFARANNLGLLHAKSPLVLFLNPDTEIKGQALGNMVEFMKANPSVGGLGCKIRDVSGSIQQLGLQWFPSPLTESVKFLAVSRRKYDRLPSVFPCHNPEESGEVRKLFGACLMVRRAVLDQVGPFDERFFMYCEDVDLCHRITHAGWKLFYLAEAEILHAGGGASDKAPGAFSALMMCESFSKFMRKHYGKLGSAAYRAVAFVGAQTRLALLLGWEFANCVRSRSPGTDSVGSRRKYVTITKWCLGLQKPLVRD